MFSKLKRLSVALLAGVTLSVTANAEAHTYKQNTVKAPQISLAQEHPFNGCVFKDHFYTLGAKIKDGHYDHYLECTEVDHTNAWKPVLVKRYIKLHPKHAPKTRDTWVDVWFKNFFHYGR